MVHAYGQPMGSIDDLPDTTDDIRTVHTSDGYISTLMDRLSLAVGAIAVAGTEVVAYLRWEYATKTAALTLTDVTVAGEESMTEINRRFFEQTHAGEVDIRVIDQFVDGLTDSTGPWTVMTGDSVTALFRIHAVDPTGRIETDSLAPLGLTQPAFHERLTADRRSDSLAAYLYRHYVDPETIDWVRSRGYLTLADVLDTPRATLTAHLGPQPVAALAAALGDERHRLAS